MAGHRLHLAGCTASSGARRLPAEPAVQVPARLSLGQLGGGQLAGLSSGCESRREQRWALGVSPPYWWHLEAEPPLWAWVHRVRSLTVPQRDRMKSALPAQPDTGPARGKGP